MLHTMYLLSNLFFSIPCALKFNLNISESSMMEEAHKKINQYLKSDSIRVPWEMCTILAIFLLFMILSWESLYDTRWVIKKQTLSFGMKNTPMRSFSYFGDFKMFTSNYFLNKHFKIMMFLKNPGKLELTKPCYPFLNCWNYTNSYERVAIKTLKL